MKRIFGHRLIPFESVYESTGFTTEFGAYETVLSRVKESTNGHVSLGRHYEFPSGKEIYDLLKQTRRYRIAEADNSIRARYSIHEKYADSIIFEWGVGTGDKPADDFKKLAHSAEDDKEIKRRQDAIENDSVYSYEELFGADSLELAPEEDTSATISPVIRLQMKGPLLYFMNDVDLASLTLAEEAAEKTGYLKDKIVKVPGDILDPATLRQKINLKRMHTRGVLETRKMTLSVWEAIQKSKVPIINLWQGASVNNLSPKQIKALFRLCRKFPRNTKSYLSIDHTESNSVNRETYGDPLMNQLVLSGYHYCKFFHPEQLITLSEKSIPGPGFSTEKDLLLIFNSPRGPAIWMAIPDDGYINWFGPIRKFCPMDTIRKEAEEAGYKQYLGASPEWTYKNLPALESQFDGLKLIWWELTNGAKRPAPGG